MGCEELCVWITRGMTDAGRVGMDTMVSGREFGATI